MNTPATPFRLLLRALLCSGALLFFVFAANAQAGSATWNLNPTSDDWNTGANWTPNTVPNGPVDVATFDVSNAAGVSLAGQTIEVAEMVFDSSASAFTFSDESRPSSLTISGLGITNNSGSGQSFNFQKGTVSFTGSATAGTDTVFTGNVEFLESASAGAGSFVFAQHENSVVFHDESTAANASFTMVGGQIEFFEFSSGGNAVLVATTGEANPASILFRENSSAGEGNFTIDGVGDESQSQLTFTDASTAGNATLTTNGSPNSTGYGAGGRILFYSHQLPGASAGNSTIINDGSANPSSIAGGETDFYDSSSGGRATLIANGGTNGGAGGRILFLLNSDGDEARVQVFGNGLLDVSGRTEPDITIGSIEGDGIVSLGIDHLTVGSNNLSTTFAGIIEGTGDSEGGSLIKTGTGRLVLKKGNDYPGGTTIEAGRLLVENKNGSATGSGVVQVNAGVLGGRGIIDGAVTLGTGAGVGAYLSPGQKTSRPGAFTVHSDVTFRLDAFYACDLNSDIAAADKLIATTVTIDNSAKIIFGDTGSTVLPAGTVFTIVESTAGIPVSGTFANLPDGGTITVSNNTYQANYEGGDGNDLTLTVVQ